MTPQAAPADPRVPADMGTLEITRGRQALELRSNLSERRALTDPIRPPGRDESSARNLQWAKAHGEGHGHPVQSWHRGGAGAEAAGSTCRVFPTLEKRNRWHRAARSTVSVAPLWGDPHGHLTCGCSSGPEHLQVPAPAVPPVLPESRHLRFDCGVTVQLGFAAEFSNIMIIYTRVVATPGDIAQCEAKLTDIPEVGARCWSPCGAMRGTGAPTHGSFRSWTLSVAGAGRGPQEHQQGEPGGGGQPPGTHLEPGLPPLLPLQPALRLAETAGKSHAGGPGPPHGMGAHPRCLCPRSRSWCSPSACSTATAAWTTSWRRGSG